MAQQGHVVGMVELASELRSKLAALHSSQAQVDQGLPPPCPIIVGKVRDHTRNVDKDEYDPDHIAIGPYNYSRSHLAMEHDKLNSLDMVLTAAKARRRDMPCEVDVYINKLKCLEESVRKCYDNTFPNITTEQFVSMLLLDGCYILSRLVHLQQLPPPAVTSNPADLQAANGAQALGTANAGVLSGANGGQAPGTANADAGVVTAQRAEALEFVRDVFYLAENQIPFFVLAKIGELTVLEGDYPVITAIATYALDLMRAQKFAKAAPAMDPTAPGNLLHLLHMHLKPAQSISPAAPVSGANGVRRWRSATDYYFAGVVFKPRAMSEQGPTRCILDVKLSSGGGTLEVPVLDIDSETWRLLRNLMQLEQRNRETVGNHVTAYCVFISQVACTAKDVELLTKRGVIVHGHGNDEEVAKCFADLCKGIMFNPDEARYNYLGETCKKLEKRFQNHPQRWMAWLWRNYFSNPWLAIGLLAAVIGLVCAIVQAVYSVLSYKHG